MVGVMVMVLVTVDGLECKPQTKNLKNAFRMKMDSPVVYRRQRRDRQKIFLARYQIYN